MVRIKNIALVALSLMSIVGAPAQAGEVYAFPANWRLENYVWNHTVVLYFTGAAGCDNGALSASGMSQDDVDRLWSMIMTAKATNKPVGIFYDGSGPSCTIASFYME
jgi:hypothetical protein